MNTLSLQAVRGQFLHGLTLQLRSGVHVVLGAPFDGTSELVELCAGVSTPRAGHVRLLGRDPLGDPALRRRIGSLLPVEALPPAADVERAVAQVLALRGQTELNARALLASFGLNPRLGLPTRLLSRAELDAVALVLALTPPEPALLVLHEPLLRASLLDVESVRSRLFDLAAQGAVVLCTTASPRDALVLSDAVLVLDRGRIERRPAPGLTELVPGHAPELHVVSPDARRLAALLAADDRVSRVLLDEASGAAVVRVQAADPATAAVAIARAVVSARLRIHALYAALPELESVRAASAALAAVAHEQAHSAARAYYYGAPR